MHANLASGTGVALCSVAGISLVFGWSVLAACLFALGCLCDLADGQIARRLSSQDSFGAVIDSTCDKLGEAMLCAGLYLSFSDAPIGALLLFSFMLGTLASYEKAVTGEHRTGIAWPEARVFGRGGRVALLTSILVGLAASPQHGHLILLVGLSALVAFNACTFAWRSARVIAAATSR